ncbi:33 kDa chaperonin [Oxobacter pfennigii]|uniref:33 kDa chaperonin n=1 Tax=Oxobacter pfennigii TaxID=36849 RepID=A0A0P9AAY5_9CLOT|nr:Hsp33 family molecular chaperone HslO [Oxobacter pfennigii]KPU42199.1 33 kDa chaperonin [Oxobacter pfennigii]
MKDRIIRGTAAGGELRFFAAITTQIVEEARKIHNTTPVASAALGRMMTAASMMGTMLKNDRDRLTVQINGGGEAGQIVTVSDNKGNVKGYISNPNIARPLNAEGKLDVGGAVGTDGRLTVIRDLGLKEPYVGYVPIISGEIAEDITYYFASSEQVPSAVALGVLVDTDNSVVAAGGFMIQAMPEASEFTRDILEFRLDEIPPVTQMIKDGGKAEDIIAELLDGMDPKIQEEYEPEFICDCSKKKVERLLLSLGHEELESMEKEEKETEVVCHFCNTKYHFSQKDIRELKESGLNQ